MTNNKLDPVFDVLRAHDLDCIAFVPGANFRRVFSMDFHLMERPLVVIVPREGSPAAIVPNLEMDSFVKTGFEGRVFDWHDEIGYAGAFQSAANAIPHLKTANRFGVEGQRMRAFEHLALMEVFPDAGFVDAHSELSSIRLQKTAEETALQKMAIEISERALETTLGKVKIGLNETDIQAILLQQLFTHGADGLAFDPIVAAGENSALPHASARDDYHVKSGDALLIDFGASFRGYHADITRTFFVSEVSDYDRAFYKTVLAANKKGREITRPGITAHDVDDAVQRVLENSQFKDFTLHKTGHGLGLEVHEAPQIMRGNRVELTSGVVFTIEPGLYRQGECGVRIEDDVLVTDDGIECLTSFSRDLRIVG